jgi:hypothetical protein
VIPAATAARMVTSSADRLPRGCSIAQSTQGTSGEPRPERSAGHARRQVRSGPLPTGRAAVHRHLVLGDPHGQWQELYHLMSPDPASTAADGCGEGLATVSADLRQDRYHLVHILDRQQGTAGTVVSGLAASLPARRRRPALPRGSRGIRRGRTRGIGRGLAQAGFQLAHPHVQYGALRPQGRVLQAQRGVLLPERRQLFRQRSEVRRLSSRPWLGRPRQQRHAHAAVVARRGSWGKPAAAVSAGRPERLRPAHSPRSAHPRTAPAAGADPSPVGATGQHPPSGPSEGWESGHRWMSS